MWSSEMAPSGSITLTNSWATEVSNEDGFPAHILASTFFSLIFLVAMTAYLYFLGVTSNKKDNNNNN